MPSGVTVSRRIGLSADASPPGCGGARAAFRAALAAAPWQRSPGSRFVRLRSRRPRTVNGCIRWPPRGRHHSAVVTGRGLSPRVAVRTGDAPQGRVPLRAAQPGLTSTQPRRAGPTCGCRSMQDVYPCVHGVFRPPCTHGYLALRGTSPELAGRLLRPGPGRRGEGSWPLPEMCARRAARVLHLIFLAVVHRPLRHAVGGHADPERVLYAAPREATTELSPADRRLPEGAPVRVPSNVCRSVLED